MVTQFDGYQRVKCIGKGAFGAAILCKRLSDNAEVVVKEIYLCDMSDAEKQLAFNEVVVLASLNHANIIRYMDSFQRDGSLFIEMEYANNGNLAQLINLRKERNKAFKEIDIVDMMMQITSAISYMHSCKILHRDLKTANIFLHKTGLIKIGDFGISKVMTTRVQAQTVVGTPYYLSPEMCEGKEYNEKSDIWAVGCILYELATFHKPFEAPTLPVLVNKISACEYEDLNDSYSSHLSQLVKDILQKDIIRRPSAKEINTVRLPEIISSLHNNRNSTTENPHRSVLYQLNSFGDNMSLIPTELPNKEIISFSASQTHYIAITFDHLVFTWGKDNYGQLGHGSINI